MRRVIGIDPGLTGGFGVLDLGDAGEVLAATLARTPTVHVRARGRNRTEYDVPAMRRLLAEAIDMRDPTIRGVEVVIEAQQAMPAKLHGRPQGGASTFRVGFGFGVWVALAVASRVSYQLVRPVAWKRHHGLIGCDKRASRLRAGEVFPTLAPIRAVDEGPAEGLLLAAFAAARGAPRGGCEA